MSPRAEMLNAGQVDECRLGVMTNGLVDQVSANRYLKLRQGLQWLREERLSAPVSAYFYWSPVDRAKPDGQKEIEAGRVLFNIPPEAGLILDSFSPEALVPYISNPVIPMVRSMGVVVGGLGRDRTINATVKNQWLNKPLVISSRVSGEYAQTAQVAVSDQALWLALGCCPELILELVKERGLAVGVKRDTTEGRVELVSFALPQKDGTLASISSLIGGSSDAEARDKVVPVLLTPSFNPIGLTFDLTRFDRNPVEQVVHFASSRVILVAHAFRRQVTQ